MSVAPPLKKRPTWNVATTVLWLAKVSGSTSVACWLDWLVNGSELTRVSGTFAAATPAVASNRAAASTMQLASPLSGLGVGCIDPPVLDNWKRLSVTVGRPGSGLAFRQARYRSILIERRDGLSPAVIVTAGRPPR